MLVADLQSLTSIYDSLPILTQDHFLVATTHDLPSDSLFDSIHLFKPDPAFTEEILTERVSLNELFDQGVCPCDLQLSDTRQIVDKCATTIYNIAFGELIHHLDSRLSEDLVMLGLSVRVSQFEYLVTYGDEVSFAPLSISNRLLVQTLEEETLESSCHLIFLGDLIKMLLNLFPSGVYYLADLDDIHHAHPLAHTVSLLCAHHHDLISFGLKDLLNDHPVCLLELILVLSDILLEFFELLRTDFLLPEHLVVLLLQVNQFLTFANL